MTIHDTIARYYADDARHFLARYQSLRDEDFDKAGRVKNFMDIVMAAEGALKAHILMAETAEDPVKLYRDIRRMARGVAELADRATLMTETATYQALKERLGDVSAGLRYSLDMWETFFPLFGDGETERYNKTVGNADWRAEAVRDVRALLPPLAQEITVDADDLEEIITEAREMRAFVAACRMRR